MTLDNMTGITDGSYTGFCKSQLITCNFVKACNGVCPFEDALKHADKEMNEQTVIDHDRDWIIGCIEHDGFIHTDRFDKANQIIHDALSADTSSDLISRANAIRWVKTECNPYGKPTLDFESGKKVIEHLEQMPSAEGGDAEMTVIPEGTGLMKPCPDNGADLIRRADAIKTIHRYRHRLDGKGQTYGFLLEEFEHQIPSAEAYFTDGNKIAEWIPCSERLPKTPKHYYEKSLYLTCTKTGYITSTYWCDGWNCLMKEDGTVYREYEMKDIVAWKPMPEPYREDGEV